MSDLALQLIAENKKAKATFLDLGNCALTEIPAEIVELGWVESVSLASEWYEWDGEICQKRKSQNSGHKNDGLIESLLCPGSPACGLSLSRPRGRDPMTYLCVPSMSRRSGARTNSGNADRPPPGSKRYDLSEGRTT
jgi:hypothetical protein